MISFLTSNDCSHLVSVDAVYHSGLPGDLAVWFDYVVGGRGGGREGEKEREGKREGERERERETEN